MDEDNIEVTVKFRPCNLLSWLNHFFIDYSINVFNGEYELILKVKNTGQNRIENLKLSSVSLFDMNGERPLRNGHEHQFPTMQKEQKEEFRMSGIKILGKEMINLDLRFRSTNADSRNRRLNISAVDTSGKFTSQNVIKIHMKIFNKSGRFIFLFSLLGAVGTIFQFL